MSKDQENDDLIPMFTRIDIATAAAGGFRDGAASVVVELPQRYSYVHGSLEEDNSGEYVEYDKAIEAIIAAGGRVK